MCNAQMAQFGTSAVGMGLEWQALEVQGTMEDGIASRNQRSARAMAADAVQRGEQEAGRIQLEASQLKGAQRNALSASGIDLQQSGTALDILAGSQAMAAYEQQQARVNAAREAWGYNEQAAQIGMQREVNKRRYEDKKTGTIIGGFGKMFSSMVPSGFGG